MQVFDRERTECVYCEKFQYDSDGPSTLSWSEKCGKNLYKWTMKSKNWVIYARVNTAIDAEAGDVHYHTSC